MTLLESEAPVWVPLVIITEEENTYLTPWHAVAKEQAVLNHFISAPLCCNSLAFAIINIHSLSPPVLRDLRFTYLI